MFKIPYDAEYIITRVHYSENPKRIERVEASPVIWMTSDRSIGTLGSPEIMAVNDVLLWLKVGGIFYSDQIATPYIEFQPVMAVPDKSSGGFYIRTHKNGTQNDNLESLPRF